MSARHFHQTLSKKNTPVGIVLCVYKIRPLCHYPARDVAVSLFRFRSSDTGASGIQCWCASMSDFMPLKLKGSWTPVASRASFACTEFSFQKFKRSWTGTTRRCECRKNRRAPETRTTRPVRAHGWSFDHCLLATCQRQIFFNSLGSSLFQLHDSRNTPPQPFVHHAPK